jgi:Na+:H+ antiporter, NhaA family
MDPKPVTAPARIALLLERFLRVEAASGIVLLGATALALLCANSPWSASYERLWHGALFASADGAHATLRFLVNDGLMTIFFLVVGLEIRREIHDGALSTLRLAALPIAAATGGIVVPAVIYALLNTEPAVSAGWAIPTATDIAFAVGVLALLGKRVDPALRVLLLAIAIADDIAAILVIAFVYAQGVAPAGLGLAAAGVAGVLALKRLRIERTLPYLVLGGVVWLGLLEAGLHPVLAGVILGLLVPVQSGTAREDDPEGAPASPAARLEQSLHPWVAYGVMPLFALANAGVVIGGLDFASASSVTLGAGVLLGLVVGKPFGIVGTTALCVRMRWCELPPGVTWSGVAVVGCLGGIGFTMSIFIAALAFADAQLLAVAKFAVLVASALAAALGLLAGRWLLTKHR